MESSNSSGVDTAGIPRERLRLTRTFRGVGSERWRAAKIAVAGVGMLGGRFVQEAVRAEVGGVDAWDFGTGGHENQATQIARPGEAKVVTVAGACEQIRPGVVRPIAEDVRHAGIGSWKEYDLVVDLTDDRALARPLTITSNGTGTPLLRVAVDGTGELELGRVHCSHGAAGSACQLCSYDEGDAAGSARRTPCPGQETPARPATLAGTAVAAAVVGVALLQAQRLLTGNDLNRVLCRELVLDLTHNQLLDLELRRCPECISGHARWDLDELDLAAAETTLDDLFSHAERELFSSEVTLAAYQHPLNRQAACECGNVEIAAGTDWARPPECRRCGAAMSWLRELQVDRVSRGHAERLGILGTPLDRLGIPLDGAMFLARAPGQRVWRFVLGEKKPAAPGGDVK